MEYKNNTEKTDRIMKDPVLEQAWEDGTNEGSSVYIHKEIKKAVAELQKPTGGKLSPLISSLLVSWIYKQRYVNKLMGDIESQDTNIVDREVVNKGIDEGKGFDKDGEVIPAHAKELKDDYKPNTGESEIKAEMF